VGRTGRRSLHQLEINQRDFPTQKCAACTETVCALDRLTVRLAPFYAAGNGLQPGFHAYALEACLTAFVAAFRYGKLGKRHGRISGYIFGIGWLGSHAWGIKRCVGYRFWKNQNSVCEATKKVMIYT
jgi:hypothetical protein